MVSYVPFFYYASALSGVEGESETEKQEKLILSSPMINIHPLKWEVSSKLALDEGLLKIRDASSLMLMEKATTVAVKGKRNLCTHSDNELCS